MVISFTPLSPGNYSNSVVFTSNGGVSTNAVTGAGLMPANLLVTPGSLNFGTVATGTTAQASFVVTNSGGALLSGTAVAGGAFAISSGSPYNVPGLGTTNVIINFTPMSVGSFTANVVFASNGGNSTNAVTGTARLTRPRYSVRVPPVAQCPCRSPSPTIHRYDHQPVLGFR